MKTSKVAIAFCIVLMLFAVFIFFGRQDQSPQPMQVTQDKPVGQTLAISQSTQHSSERGNVVSSQSSEVNEQPKAEPWNSPAGYEHVEKWRESRGYFSDTDFQMYENYGIETVEQLAMDGDIKALRTLVRMYLTKGESELIMSTLRETAMRGSSEALILVGMIEESSRDSYEFKVPDGDVHYKKKMLESLAIFKAASMRGDREVDVRITEARSKVTLTPDDDRYIEQRGTEIYNEMQEKRNALGLGPFDNSVPSQVNDYYNDEVKRSSLK